jgi:hypothetical protein
MRRAALLFLWGTCAYAQQGSIEGVAVNRVSGQPLPGVHVRLLLFSADAQGISAAYGSISDKAGHFSIATIKPGTYVIAPEYPGFLYVPPKSDTPIPALLIKAGQKLEGYKLEMTPRAVLAGRIVDEFGDPVTNVQIQAMPLNPADAAMNLFGNQNPRVDDRGEFRISTVPGKYYLKATAYSNSNDQPEIRSDGSVEVVYGPTFYPSAASKERAALIEAGPGSDVTGLEIRLLRQRSLTISGTVTGIPDSMGRATVMVRYGETEQQINNSRSSMAEPNGKFSLTRLSPGFYHLTALYSTNNLRLQSGTVDIKLDDADHTNVELALGGGAELTGTLQVTGLSAEKRSVKLQSTDNFQFYNQTAPAADVAPDGTFKIANVTPGKYKVVVSPLPDDGYVKTVLLDNAASGSDVLDLSRGVRGSHVKVVASSGAAQMSGKVLDKDGQPITNSVSIVCLMQDPKVVNEDVMTRVTSSDGSYSKKGIRPGKYRLFALDIFHYVGAQGAQSNDLSEPFSRGEEIEIKEGEKLVKDIKVLEKEDANAKKQ